MTVFDELLIELFSKDIILSEGKIAGVHVVPRKPVKVGIGTVDDMNATGGDLAVDSGELSVDDVPPRSWLIASKRAPSARESAFSAS